MTRGREFVADRETSLRVLICGPDGSGKSTLVQAIRHALSAEGWTVEQHHFSPGLIPKRRELEDVQVTTPHKEPARSWPLDVLRILVRWLDYSLGYGTSWRKRPGKILLIERGWHDQWVDATRYRSTQRSQHLIRLLGRTLPQYDVAILLAGDPAVIAARKTELSTWETERQISAWTLLLGELSKRVVILDSVLSREADVLEESLTSIREALDGR